MTTSGPALLTVVETAIELRVSPDTVYRRIASGDLLAIDIAPDGAWKPKTRVRRSDLDAYLESRPRTVTPHTS